MPYRRLNIPLTSDAATNPDRPIPAITLASDTFARADTTKGDLGVTEIGGLAWEQPGDGRWRILEQKANLADPIESFALLDLAVTSYRVRAGTSLATNGRPAIVARYVDNQNYLIYGKIDASNSTYRVYQVVAGVSTRIVDTGVGGNTISAPLGLLIQGDTVQITDPPGAVTGTSYPIPAELADGTRAGFWGMNGPTVTINHFTATDK